MRDEVQELGVTIIDRPALDNLGSASASPVRRYVYSSVVSSPAVTLRVQTAGWVLEAAKKLEALSKLEPGWDSYGGSPLKPEARQATVLVMRLLENAELPDPAVVLGSAGSVHLEWRAKGRELDVSLGESDSIEFVKMLAHGEVEEGSISNLLAELRSLAGWLLHG
jgi:hypothetical protein